MQGISYPSFHPDTRRGYARVIPVALSHIGVPESCTLPVDDFPKDGLGVYDDYETCGKFSGYIWATWTTMIAQPMQVNAALQALLNPTAQASSSHSAGHLMIWESLAVVTILVNLSEAMGVQVG